MACEQCGAASAEFFTTEGAQVCQRCFNSDQIQLQDARAQASLAEEMPEGLRRAKASRPAKPGRVLLIGSVMLGIGLLGNVGLLLVAGEVDFKLLGLLGFAAVVTLQGYKTRHYQ